MDLQAELGVETGGAPDVVTLAAARMRDPAALARAIAAAHAARRETRGLGAVRPSRARRVASDRTEFAPAGSPVRPSPPWQTALGRPAYPREVLGR